MAVVLDFAPAPSGIAWRGATRILQGSPATVGIVWLDADGEPVEPAGLVTVAVTTASGAPVVAGGTATAARTTVDDIPGIRTVDLTAAQTATLDLLVATWTDTVTGIARSTFHEVVGGYFFGLSQARRSDKQMESARYSDDDILAGRTAVETECEQICGVAFVPRYQRVQLDVLETTYRLQLPTRWPRRIRELSYLLPGSAVPSTATDLQLAAATWAADGLVDLRGGFLIERGARVTVGYETGHHRPPADLVLASMIRLRYLLDTGKSDLSDRSPVFDANDLVYSARRPSWLATGIPDVDAVYGRYSERTQGGDSGDGPTLAPASGQLIFAPSAGSLFHGRFIR